MVIGSSRRVALTIPLAAIIIAGFCTSVVTAGEPHAVSGVVGTADAPPPSRAALDLEVVAADDRGTVTLRFTLPRAGIVRITLSTLDGKEVGTLASGLSSAGENRIDIDVRKIPAGQYRCTLQTRDGNASTRLVVTGR